MMGMGLIVLSQVKLAANACTCVAAGCVIVPYMLLGQGLVVSPVQPELPAVQQLGCSEPFVLTAQPHMEG